MLMQTGMAAQIETLVTLAGTTDFRVTKKLASLNALKERYRYFLASLAQRSVDLSCREPAYATTAVEASHLAALFSNDSVLDDKRQSDIIAEGNDPERRLKQERLEGALREISLYSPSYADIFRTVVTDIFILPSAIARAGSTSAAIGVIWLNPKLSYPIADVMEILLHEFTHQAMFLDELRYGHYSYGTIRDRSTWAKSAILNLSRPIDKVLHSLVVATEVLLFRQRHIGRPAAPRAHPPTSILLQQLDESLSSVEAAVRKHPNILMSRAKDIVGNVRGIVDHTLRPSAAASQALGGLLGHKENAI